MEIFNSSIEHDVLSNDLELVYTCFNDVKSRIAEKTLDNLIDRIIEEMHLNITAEAATEVARLEEKYPDDDFVTIVDFLVWKQDFKLMSAKDFATEHPDTIDENEVWQVRVYKDGYFIEVVDNGENPDTHRLTIENSSWFEPETPLEEMEMHLFRFYRLNKEAE